MQRNLTRALYGDERLVYGEPVDWRHTLRAVAYGALFAFVVGALGFGIYVDFKTLGWF